MGKLENQFDRKIRNTGLIAGFGSLSLILSSLYFSEVQNEGFSKEISLI